VKHSKNIQKTGVAEKTVIAVSCGCINVRSEWQGEEDVSSHRPMLVKEIVQLGKLVPGRHQAK